jgi:hypothetical protein
VRARLSMAAVATLASVVALVATPAAAQDSDAGASPDSAKTLTTDRPEHDVLASPTDVDVFRFDVAAELSVVRATITRTGNRCEVWARLLDVDGIELGRVFVDGSGSEVLSALAPTAGPYFVAVDNGPYARCSGAGYRVELAVVILPSANPSQPPAAPGQRGRAAASSPDVATVLLCDAYSKRVDRLTTVVRRDRHGRARASGRHRARLTRKLRRDRRSLRGARAKATRYCASSA